jgi:hypothetical protein
LQNPNQIDGDNVQNLRPETSRTFRNRKREYLKGKINELETNNKNKNIRDLYRGISEFKKGYQPRINIIKDENGNLLADPQKFSIRGKISLTRRCMCMGFIMLDRRIYIQLSH